MQATESRLLLSGAVNGTVLHASFHSDLYNWKIRYLVWVVSCLYKCFLYWRFFVFELEILLVAHLYIVSHFTCYKWIVLQCVWVSGCKMY